MATEAQPTAPPHPAPAATRVLPLIRLVLAVIGTVCLAYPWGRVLVISMQTGKPEGFFLGELVVGMAGVMALTSNLGPALAGFRWNRAILPGIALGWIFLNGSLVIWRNGTLLAWPWVAGLFIPATLWVPWLAWMFYRQLRAAIRWGVLLLFLALVPPSQLLEVKGLTGESNVDFAFRFGDTKPLHFVEPEAGAAPAPGIDLSKVGNHDYPQYLGAQRLGSVPNVRLARDWKTHPPREMWRRPVGSGWGSFAVVGAYAVTQEQRDDRECVVCYRVSDGSTVWVHHDLAGFEKSMGGPGPRATPTIAGGRVYAVGVTGILNCLDGSTGERIWSVDILKDNEAANIEHGVCGSPLVLDDKVIVNPTGKNGYSLVAYDRDTKARRWQGGKDQASYGSAVVAELGGMRQILLYNAAGVAGHDPANGNVLWTFPWTNGELTNCSQPIPNAGAPDQVFVSTGYGGGCALFLVEQSPDGAWSARSLWERKYMRTKFTTAVLYEDHIYGLDEGIMECIDLKGGARPLWKGKRYNHGQILLAGDLIIVQAENGDVVLFEPVPDEPRELGKVRALTSKTWNNPALAGRYLLVRNDREAVCYELALAETTTVANR